MRELENLWFLLSTSDDSSFHILLDKSLISHYHFSHGAENWDVKILPLLSADDDLLQTASGTPQIMYSNFNIRMTQTFFFKSSNVGARKIVYEIDINILQFTPWLIICINFSAPSHGWDIKKVLKKTQKIWHIMFHIKVVNVAPFNNNRWDILHRDGQLFVFLCSSH